jgi:hypothetical protein
MANAVTQMTQDLRLSTVGTGAVEAIVEETLVEMLVLTDINRTRVMGLRRG